MTTCTWCGKQKENTEFYYSKGKLKHPCKICFLKGGRERHLKKTYGLSLEDYRGMKKKQNGVCRICETLGHTIRGHKYPLNVDHNHKTGIVRGLVCYRCNIMIGFFEDYRNLLNRIEKYVETDGKGELNG